MHLVKPGWISKERGQQLSRTHELRLIADYKGDPVEAADAAAIVGQAEEFVAAIGASVSSQAQPPAPTHGP